MKRYLHVLLATLFILSCSDEKNSDLDTTTLKTMQTQSLRFLSTNGKAITNAKVVIGSHEEAFHGSVQYTDQEGFITIPETWRQEEPVTIMAEGYIRTTFLHQKPESKTFRINKFYSQPEHTISGVTSGYGTLKRDDKIDFGLVLPLLPKRAYFQFDLGLFISPESDVVHIMGNRLNIPTNVSLPDQSERYLFFNIRFNKPQYRSYFFEEGNYNLIASHGQFPFKKMINEFQSGKGFTEVVNYFDFIEGSLHIAQAPSVTDLAVNQHKFQGAMVVTSPQLPDEFSYFVASLQTQNYLHYPSDIKRINSYESIGLKMSPLGTSNFLLATVAKEEKLESGATRLNPAMSIAILPYVGGTPQTYMPLVAVPTAIDNKLILDAPATTAFYQVATYVSLQDVRIEEVDDSYKEHVTKVWEIYSDHWEDQIELPHLRQSLEIHNHLRWESLYLGSRTRHLHKVTGPEIFDVAEYVSRNATNL